MNQEFYKLLDEVFGTQLTGKRDLITTVYPNQQVIVVSSRVDFCIIAKNMDNGEDTLTFKVRQTIWKEGKKTDVYTNDAAVPGGSQASIQFLLDKIGVRHVH